MNIESLLIAKVYRKKEVQEITDRNTGRVTGLYYPVIFDDGNDTFNMSVPQDVYEAITEDKVFCFVTRFNDNFARDNQKPKPKIVSVFSELPSFSGSNFITEFYSLVSNSLTSVSADTKSANGSKKAVQDPLKN